MGFGKYIFEDVFIEFVLVQMASVSQVVDKLSEHLTCQICLEVYKQPKSLPCQHTFCCGCLQDYFKKQVHLKGEHLFKAMVGLYNITNNMWLV